MKPPEEKVFNSDNLQRILICLCFVSVVVLFPFLQAFALNVSNLQFPLIRFLQPLAVVSGLGFISLYLALKVMPSKLEAKFQAAILFVAIVAFLQTNFFIGDFGFLDGREPDWERARFTSLLQLTFELALLVLFVLRFLVVFQNIKFISFLILISSMLSLYPYYPTLLGDDEKKYVFNENRVFDFSSSSNVIVILVDTLQSDVFNEVIEEQSELKEQLEGFTYFRNNVGAFSKTYASVPAILSGTVFDNSTTLPVYLKKAYRELSLPSVLLKEGFDVRLHSFAPYSLEAHTQVAMNVSGTKGSAADVDNFLQRDAVLLSNLLIFRLSPHVFKEWVYNDGRFRIPVPLQEQNSNKCHLSDSKREVSQAINTFDTKFFDAFNHCANVSIEEDVFRYFHISGAHAPFQFGKKFEYIGQQKINRENFKNQIKGVFHQLNLLLDKLRELDVYENATIVILGDHGGGDLAVDLNLNQPGLPTRPKPHLKLSKQKVMGGIPALLYKPARSSGELAISDAPVNLTDVAKTISDALGYEDKGFPGINLFQVEPGSERTRLHKYYVFGGWDIDYILPLTEYEVKGFSWFPESWSASRRNLNIITDSSYDGLIVSMVGNGNLKDYEASGWSPPQESGTYIERYDARLNLEKSFEGDVVLQMAHQNFPVSAQSTETIVISLDGHILGQWQFYAGDGQRKKTVVIPSSLASKLDRLPLILTTDKSESKVNIKEIRIVDSDIYEYVLGEEIDFSNTGFGKKYQAYGWSASGKRGSYSLGFNSRLLISLGSIPQKDLKLSIDLDALVFKSWNEQEISVFVNDVKIKDMIFRDTRSHQVSLNVPVDNVNGSRLIDVRFEYHDAIQPAKLGTSTDTRYLAFVLNKLIIGKVNEELSVTDDFPRRFSLSSENGREILKDNEGVSYLKEEGLKGYMDSVREEDKHIRFSGWAINQTQPSDRLKILVVYAGEQLTVRNLGTPRVDVGDHFGNREFDDSGYSFTIPSFQVHEPEKVRIFVISEMGYGSEIKINW
ncbi:MAG: hypothetical protein ACI9CE_002424 [Flavobacterium sp.]